MRPRVFLGPAALVSALFIGAAGAVAEELTCVFDMTVQVAGSAAPVAPGTGRAAPARVDSPATKETHRTVVDLARDSIAETREGESTMAYHFPSRRMYILDLRERTFADVSLYGQVAFCVNELVNRRAMGEGFAAAGVFNDPGARDVVDPFTVESLFRAACPGMPGGPTPRPPRSSGAGRNGSSLGAIGDSSGSSLLNIRSRRDTAGAGSDSWPHQCRIHPTIRDQIVGTGAIPDLLEFSLLRRDQVLHGDVPAASRPARAPTPGPASLPASGPRWSPAIAWVASWRSSVPGIGERPCAPGRRPSDSLTRPWCGGTPSTPTSAGLEYSTLAGGDAGSRPSIDSLAREGPGCEGRTRDVAEEPSVGTPRTCRRSSGPLTGSIGPA